MKIKKILIENFKTFNKRFVLELNDNINIIVGKNGEGKSTIIDAIHLCLTGYLNGKYIKNDISQYLFNNEIEEEYIKNLDNGNIVEPPHLIIELYFEDDKNIPKLQKLKGRNNLEGDNVPGIKYKIEFDEKWLHIYDQLVKSKFKTIPVEYFKITREAFSDTPVNNQMIPVKSSLIDSSVFSSKNGSDIYVSRIIQNILTDSEKINLSKSHREMKETFKTIDIFKSINQKLKLDKTLSSKNVSISVDMSTQSAWESTLMTYLDEVPFNHIGKGEQTILKTELSLKNKKTEESNIILIEEPENHLTYTKLSDLINKISKETKNKQVIISTHSSFVSNKLGLSNLILLSDLNIARFKDLKTSTSNFFKKLPGYNILRLILSEEAILVEGDCDELVVQKLYKNKYGCLPIENGVDVICVGGLTFLRYLELAALLEKKVSVVTDNDGKLDSLRDKYKDYNDSEFIKVFYDEKEYESKNKLNYNTLEPCIVRANDLKTLNKILDEKFTNVDDLIAYMLNKNNKTEVALSLFDTEIEFNAPDYIEKAITRHGK